MRSIADAEKVQRFMEALGRRARGEGQVFLVGGATAVLHGWRPTTVDIDLKLDPEPAGAFEAIGRLKDELDVNVELAAPDQFIPSVPGWRERSVFVTRHGSVEFFHYDPVSQALAKLERGYARDVDDVRAMLARQLLAPADILAGFHGIRPGLERYPAVDADAFEAKVRGFLATLEEG